MDNFPSALSQIRVSAGKTSMYKCKDVSVCVCPNMSERSALRVWLHVGRQTEVAYFDKLRSAVNFNHPPSSTSHPPPDYGMHIISFLFLF